MDREQIAEIKNLIKEGTVLTDEPMARHTTFRVGGPAEILAEPTQEELLPLLSYIKERNLPYYVLGNGSNVLVSDEGLPGVVILLGTKMGEIRADGTRITAQAGALLSQLSAFAADRALTGLEFASGIPGSVGGAVVMNAGAYGGEMKDVITEVSVLKDKEVVTYTGAEMEFSYRHSRILDEDGIVLSATVSLQSGEEGAIKETIRDIGEKRREKQPLNYPSAGSTFKRPEGYFAGKLIQDAGLLGYRVGGAMVSEKHGGFVINADHATAAEIHTLILDVQRKVKDAFGVDLEPEVRMMGRF